MRAPSSRNIAVRQMSERDRAPLPGRAAEPDSAPARGLGTLLIPALLIFLLTSPATFLLIGQDPSVIASLDIAHMSNEAGSQVLLYVVRFGAMAVALLYALRQRVALVGRLRRLAPIGPFAAWAALSILWSDNVAISWHNVAALIALIVTAYCLVLALAPRDIARAIVIAGLMTALASILYVVLLPDQGIHQRNDAIQAVHAGAWRGVYIHKNFLGHVVATFAAAIFWADASVIRSRIAKWAAFLLLLGIGLMTTSASAPFIPAIAILLTWVVVVASPARRLLAMIVGVPAFVIGLVAVPLILQAIGRDESFSGRDVVWQIAFDSVLERPLHGFGYVCLTYGDFSYRLFRATTLIDPHNGYLDTILGTGVIGLLLLLVAITVAVVEARTLYRQGGPTRQAALALFSLLVCWMLSSMTETFDRPFTPMGGLGLFALAALMALSARRGLGTARG